MFDLEFAPGPRGPLPPAITTATVENDSEVPPMTDEEYVAFCVENDIPLGGNGPLEALPF